MSKRLTYAEAVKLSPALVDALRALNGSGLKWGTIAPMEGVSLKLLRAAGMSGSLESQSTWLNQRSLPHLWAMPSGQMELTLGLSLYTTCREEASTLSPSFGAVQPIALARVWRAYRELRPSGLLQIEHLFLGAQAFEFGHLALRNCAACYTIGLELADDQDEDDNHRSFEAGCLTCRLKKSLMATQYAIPRRRRRKKTTKVQGEPVSVGAEADADADAGAPGVVADLFQRMARKS